jgi:hypothetical protein
MYNFNQMAHISMVGSRCNNKLKKEIYKCHKENPNTWQGFFKVFMQVDYF